jgi:hypothetical protein
MTVPAFCEGHHKAPVHAPDTGTFRLNPARIRGTNIAVTCQESGLFAQTGKARITAAAMTRHCHIQRLFLP